MSGGCQEDVRRLAGGCQEDVRRLSEGCQEDVRRLSGGCQAAVRRRMIEYEEENECEQGGARRVRS